MKEQRKAGDTSVEQPLFILSRHPYKGMCSSSIARWVKEVLKEVALTQIPLKPTRLAAASLAKKSTADIMQLAGWTRFYNKPLKESNYILILSFVYAQGGL